MSPGDRLLYAISAKQEMGWPVFKRTFELLCTHHLTEKNLEDMKFARYETARVLDALGHVEVDFGSSARLYAAPPALALLPSSGLPVAVLAGARAPNTIDLLSARLERTGGKFQLDIRLQRDESKRFPARIAVTGESVEDLARFASEAGLAFQEAPASWKILNFAGSLGDYLSGCEWLHTDRLSWDERTFDVQELRFSPTRSDSGLLLIRYIHPSRQYPLYYLWRGIEAARVDPDWGRFAALKEAGRNILHYDHSASAVFLPATVPLPKLLARALCLCSGLVPPLISGSARVDSTSISPLFKVYPNVPYEFAQIVATKLDQSLITDFTLLEIEND
jgi:hypothetical protein